MTPREYAEQICEEKGLSEHVDAIADAIADAVEDAIGTSRAAGKEAEELRLEDRGQVGGPHRKGEEAMSASSRRRLSDEPTRINILTAIESGTGKEFPAVTITSLADGSRSMVCVLDLDTARSFAREFLAIIDICEKAGAS